jgi:nucleoside-diphosphate-sugar epimerase
VIARVFGLLAPGQPANYVLPGLIARVREGRLTDVPGLDMTRDYLDARDVCRDLLALGLAPLPTGARVVNVCSGEPTTIRELLAAVLRASGDPDPAERARAATAAPGRADDTRWLVGDPSAFVRLTGLAPRSITLLETARDALALAGVRTGG